MSDTQIDITRARLLQFKGRYPEICVRTGLSYSWLSKFARGDRGLRPSFDLITRLQTELDLLEAGAGPAHRPDVRTQDATHRHRSTAAPGEAAETAEVVLTREALVA